MSGEKYAKKARAMIPKAIEDPSIEHIQGILILINHEYGLARVSRCYTYTGLAIRMAYQLNLHKEHMFRDYDIDKFNPDREPQSFLLTVEEWMQYEDRRRLFWEIYMQDTITSAYAGKPTMMGTHDLDVLLPIYNSTYEVLSTPVEYFQPSIDGRQCMKYAVIRDSTGQITSIQVTPVLENVSKRKAEENSLTMHPLTAKNHIGLEPRIIQLIVLFAEISKYLNQESSHNKEEWMRLDQALDDWAQALPVSLHNTRTNLEYFREHENKPFKSGQFITYHLLYNTLTILLNRYAFVLTDEEDLTENLDFANNPIEQSKIETAKQKCLEAVNNVTDMLKELGDRFDVIPPFCIYFIYITATVIVNSCFSAETEEDRKNAKLALNQCLNVLAGMRNYWATADRTYFVICDFYMLHEKINRQQLRQKEQLQQLHQQHQQHQQQPPKQASHLQHDYSSYQAQQREGLSESLPTNNLHSNYIYNNASSVSHNSSSSISSPFALPLATMNSLFYSDLMAERQSFKNSTLLNSNDLLNEALSFDCWLQQQQRHSDANKQQYQPPK
ncbi:fungal-specific transcription factor domain-containing protein [Mycotypha africana]|uniref:fungal-specific transcription factor domain-containing protein n=1 Tax=Mycotypha africana TaxID=64632 RepID=UPI0023009C61|nr:fungal-specific transcription factor domain-containing protein [Mycotypha africana]KAI8979159.1 fungal-specific transcription factor domain-containing protein [Mycotypha africana]